MANYKIADTTLTSIGDAIRRKVGETREEMAPFENPYEFNFDYADYVFNDIPLLPSGYRGLYLPVVTNKDAKRAEILYECEGKGGINYLDLRTTRYSYGGNRDKFDDTTAISLNYSGTKNISFNGEEQYLVLDIGFREHDDTQLKIKLNICLYDANDNLITQELVEVPNTMTPAQMAQAIDDIAPAPTDEELVITGDCSYRFSNDGWNWFINKYGDKITTNDITTTKYMFYNSSELEEIPFEINIRRSNSSTGNDISHTFEYCDTLKSIPKINNALVGHTSNMFAYCKLLRTLPEGIEDWFDWSLLDNLTSAYDGSRSYLFYNCYSLRKIPMDFMKHGSKNSSYNNSIYAYCFNYCYVLDEIIGLPFPHYNATWTSNAFNSTFSYCHRLKNMTFAVQEDGTPYSMKWKKQTIDLSQQVGYCQSSMSKPLSDWNESDIKSAAPNIINYNSGITLDKAIYNDETYALLKDDEDAFCVANNSATYPDYGYSRYNHDSAVATINSLPDTSAYLATAGGTNTIKFFGRAGGKTDGGAINTLTAEEIAVATAKGWTVSLV